MEEQEARASHGVMVLHPDLEVDALESLHCQLHGGTSVASSGASDVLPFHPTRCSR
jgi:hypothetical protein